MVPATFEDYRIELDCYAGPLDLLLYLVRRHEIDLHDIPIAKLTEQYLQHLRLIQQIDVNLAGEFLVMAATLLEIKSQMLLPRPEAEQGDAAGDEAAAATNPLDPRYELVQQLLAYKRFKDAASALDDRRSEWESRYPCHPAAPERVDPLRAAAPSEESPEEEPSGEVEIDLEDVHVLDLCEAFSRILESIGQTPGHTVVYDDTPIALHAEDVVDRLQRDAVVQGGFLTLRQIFEGRQSRSEMIGLFLAVLELVRQRRVRVVQEANSTAAPAEIRLELQPSDAAELPAGDASVRWTSPTTGEVEYEWPSEAEKRRAERRAKLRAAWANKRGQAGASPSEDLDAADLDAEELEDTPAIAEPPETAEPREESAADAS